MLTPTLEQKIPDKTLKSRPPDATHWRVCTLARHLGVTRTLVHGVWQPYHVQPHRVERFKLSNDPRYKKKVRDVVGLYVDPPGLALVLCVDEKSQIQALDRTAPLPPLRKRRRFHSHFTPTSSSWLNQVERWSGLITEKMIRRGTFHSADEPERSIYLWLAN